MSNNEVTCFEIDIMWCFILLEMKEHLQNEFLQWLLNK